MTDHEYKETFEELIQLVKKNIIYSILLQIIVLPILFGIAIMNIMINQNTWVILFTSCNALFITVYTSYEGYKRYKYYKSLVNEYNEFIIKYHEVYGESFD